MAIYQINQHQILIDDEDIDLLERNWQVITTQHGCSYVSGNFQKPSGRWTRKYLHRIILSRVLNRDLHEWEQVDHEDLNSLNNTRKNLRLASNGQNQANKSKQKNNTTGFKGVRKNKSGSSYSAYIQVEKKQIYLGNRKTPEAAHELYKEAAIKHFGEFARW